MQQRKKYDRTHYAAMATHALIEKHNIVVNCVKRASDFSEVLEELETMEEIETVLEERAALPA